MEKAKKTILVTGGAGFIGSFLCEKLLKDGHQVICIDNFSTGHVRNIDPYLRYANFQFLKLDINQPFDLESFAELDSFDLPFHGIQEIYHLAAPTSIKNFDNLRQQTLLAHSIGTRNILDIAVKYKSRILLGSSSVIYGGRTETVKVFHEDYQGIVDHLTPRACYDEGKRFAETMFQTYADVHGLDIRIARIFRTYGPRMPLFDGHQIPDFVLNALNGDDLVINGDDGFQSSLLYISDLIYGLLELMKAKQNPGPVNFGSDIDLPIKDVAQQIIDMTDSSSKIVHAEELAFLTELGIPDLKKAEELLGWMPLIRLEDGLKKTIDYIRANKLLLTNE